MAQKNILTNFTVVAGVEGQNTLQSLAKQLDGLSFSAKKLGNDLRSVSGGTGIQQITKDSEKAKISVNGLTAALDDYRVKILAAGVAAQQFVKTLVAILEVQGRIDQLEVGLNLVNDGNTRKIADDLEFLKDTTNRLGLEFTQTSVLYTKFAAAAKESGFSASQTREVFDSFAGATARLSLSADSANRVFFALQQIVSKGTVSSEELKNQLGEKIPGVMAIAAKAFDGGKGDIEAFNKALADGKVNVDDFLIPFAERIRESLGVASGESVNTATAAFGRFKNSYDELLKAVVDSGLGDAVVRLFEGATVAIGDASESIRDLKADTQAFFDAIDFDKLQLLAEVFVGLKGASVGAATGAAIGSVVPGVGTAVGAAVGAGVGYLGGAAATNEVINQARFGKQEEFNRLLERQASIEKEIDAVTKRRDSNYGKNFLNQKALTEEIQALQMEGIQIDLQLINSNKQVSDSVAQYGKEINSTFQEADNLDKAEQRAAKAADKRKDQLKGLTEELDGVNKKYVEGKKVLDASLAAGDIDIAQYNKRLKQLEASTQKKSKENTAYQSVIKSLNEQNTKFKEELGLIEKRTETEKLRERALEATKGKIDAVTEAKLKENAALEEALKIYKEEIELTKKRAKIAEDLASDAIDQAKKGAEDAAQRNKQLEEEIARIGLKAEAIAELEARTLALRAAELRGEADRLGGPQSGEAAEEMLREAVELEKQIGLIRQKAVKEIALERSEAEKKANMEVVDNFVDLFKEVSTKSSKQFADDLKKAIKVQFTSFVLRVGVEAALGVNSKGEATGGGLLGSFGSSVSQSFFKDAITSGFSAALSSSAAYAAAVPGLTSAAAGSQAALLAAQTAEFGAAGLASTSAAAGSAAGGFASSALSAAPYIAAAVFIVTALRKKKISAELLGNAEFGFNAQGMETSAAGNAGGFVSDIVRDGSQRIADAYIGTVEALGGKAIDQFSIAFGANTGRQGQDPQFGLGVSVGGNRLFTQEETQLNDANAQLATLRATFALLQQTDFADNIDAVVQGIDFASASFEELNEVLANSQLLSAVNNLTEFGGAIATLSGASLETVQSLVQLTGGIQGLQQGYQAFYDAFTSEEQKRADLTASVTKQLAEFNLTIPTTRDGLRKIVDGLNLQDEADQRLYATILALTPALNQLIPAFEDVSSAAEQAAQAAKAQQEIEQEIAEQQKRMAEELAQAIQKAESDLRSAYERQRNELQQTVTKFAQFNMQIKDLRKTLALNFLSGADGVSASRGAFDSVISRLRGGDESAFGEVAGVSQEYLNRFGDFSNDFVSYAREFAYVQNSLSEIELLTANQISDAEMQLQRLDAQVDGLLTINESVLTVTQAVQQLTDTITGRNRKPQQKENPFANRTQAESILGGVGRAGSAGSAALVQLAESLGFVTPSEYAAGFPGQSLSAQQFIANILGNDADLARQLLGGYDVNLAAALGDVSLEALTERFNQLVPKFATGGMVTSPTLAMIGEGGMNEAVVPLPNGRSIPVQMMNPMGMSPQNMNADMIRELKELRMEMQQLREENRAGQAVIANNTGKVARVIDRSDNGDSLNVTMVTA